MSCGLLPAAGRSPSRRIALLSLALAPLCACVLNGCSAQWLGKAIIWVPNTDRVIDPASDPTAAQLGHLGVAQQLRVSVGPPPASLSLWVIDPPADVTACGTILVLHGLNDSKTSMLGLGQVFAEQQYRAVLVDLRGHGRSTGQWGSYGVFESRDLRQLIDDLQERGLISGEVGVFGPSWGGAAALQLAAIDPRIQAVVTVATFASMRDVVPRYLRRQIPFSTLFIGDTAITHAIDEAGRIAGFNPDDASAVHAVSRTHAQILLIHGEHDAHIPVEHSIALHEAAPDHCRVVIIEGAGHDTIMTGRYGRRMIREALAWFDHWLGNPSTG